MPPSAITTYRPPRNHLHRYYKIVAEALRAASLMVGLMRPDVTAPFDDKGGHAAKLYDAIQKRMLAQARNHHLPSRDHLPRVTTPPPSRRHPPRVTPSLPPRGRRTRTRR